MREIWLCIVSRSAGKRGVKNWPLRNWKNERVRNTKPLVDALTLSSSRSSSRLSFFRGMHHMQENTLQMEL